LHWCSAHPDINLILLDLNLPGVRGFEALDQLRREQPAMPVVILSMHRDRLAVLEAFRRGAMGFIPKASAKAVIVSAVRLVLSGGVYVPPEAVAEADGSRDDGTALAVRSQSPRALNSLGLTARQEQVLALLMRGSRTRTSVERSASPSARSRFMSLRCLTH
jgi:DNA-binding NarL/FixJ family response regulator